MGMGLTAWQWLAKDQNLEMCVDKEQSLVDRGVAVWILGQSK